MQLSEEIKQIQIKVISESDDLLPQYTTTGAAGADIRANIQAPITIEAHKHCLIPTGLRFEIPEGYEVQIRPRSGLAAKFGVTVLNAPGTIDSDYRGEVKVILINHSSEDFVVTHGMRIAQMVIAPVQQAAFCMQSELTSSERGSGGFGHTGSH